MSNFILGVPDKQQIQRTRERPDGVRAHIWEDAYRKIAAASAFPCYLPPITSPSEQKVDTKILFSLLLFPLSLRRCLSPSLVLVLGFSLYLSVSPPASSSCLSLLLAGQWNR